MTEITSTTELSRRPRPKWRRFTLRALFLVVLAAATLSGWVAYRIRQFHAQAAFIADLRLRGFMIETVPVKHAWFWEPIVGDDAVEVNRANLVVQAAGNRLVGPSAEDLEQIALWTNIEWLQLYGPNVTNETLLAVSSFQYLKGLMLYQAEISDVGLEPLRSLKELKFLQVADHMVHHQRANGTWSGDAVRYIADIPTLQNIDLHGVSISGAAMNTMVRRLPLLTGLNLDCCNVHDAVLRPLSHLSKLAQLSLKGNGGITDEGVQHLVNLPSLIQLDVRDTSVTITGVERLQREKPALQLIHNCERTMSFR